MVCGDIIVYFGKTFSKDFLERRLAERDEIWLRIYGSGHSTLVLFPKFDELWSWDPAISWADRYIFILWFLLLSSFFLLFFLA